MKTRLKSLLAMSAATALVAMMAACAGPQQPEDAQPAEEASSEETPAAEKIQEAKEAAEAEANQPPEPGAEWGYGADNGPAQWGTIDPAFAMCDLGKNQSPVDFTDTLEAPGLPDPALSYDQDPSELVHMGFALQVNYPEGNQLTVGGESYNLLQMHFHTPGEHTVEGDEFALEAHFVHADEDGNLAVIGVLFEEGEANEQLDVLLENPPTEKGQKVSLVDAGFESTEMLPVTRDHYRYNGSLTTPPCSEGVRFFILSEPVSASAEQVEGIREAVGHDNARPVQPTNARIIAE